MKRPQPDVGESIRDDFIGNLKTVRGLLRLWGTQIVNGVEVFTPRQYYHKESDRSENFEKLFKFLGAYDSLIEADTQGLRSAWMYFNKNNGTDLDVDYDDFVAGNLNKMWWDDADGVRPENLTLTTSIVIEAYNFNPVSMARIEELLNPSMPESIAAASIQANYEELWDLCSITQEGVGIINKGSIVDPVNSVTIPDEDDLTPDDPWLGALSRHVLRDPNTPSTIKNVRIGTMKRSIGPFLRRYLTTYIVDIEIPYKEFFNTSGVVNSITADLNVVQTPKTISNSYATSSQIRSMSSTDIEDDVELVTRNYDLWEDQTVTNGTLTDSLWFSFDGFWYLRAAPFIDPKSVGLTYKELSNYVLTLLDSGYKKKKVPAWKKWVAAVLVVVAILISWVPGAQGLTATLIAVAKLILVATLVLTLVILALTIIGAAEWASAFATVSKWMEPLALIATIILIVTGIGEAIEAAKTAAKDAAEAAGKDYVEQSVTDIVLDLVEERVTDFVQDIVKGAVDVFSGNFATNAAMAFTSGVTKLINHGMSLKLESISDRNRDLKAEYDKLVEEANTESNTLIAFSKVYAKPATADWAIFAARYDLPFERGGGNLAMGGIQRTTVQALRKADYTDPAFAGIMFA